MSRRFGRNQKRKLITKKDEEINFFKGRLYDLGMEYERKLRHAEAQREKMAAALAHSLEQQFRPDLRIKGHGERPTVSVDMSVRSSNDRQVIVNSIDLDIHAILTLANPEAKDSFVKMIADKFVEALRAGQGLRIGF